MTFRTREGEGAAATWDEVTVRVLAEYVAVAR